MGDYVTKLRQWANDCVERDRANRKVRTKSPIQVARFMSTTTRGVSYDLIKWNNKFQCTCPGFQYRRKCKHVDAVT